MPEDILGNSPNHLNADGGGEYRENLAKCSEAWYACSAKAGLDGEKLGVCVEQRMKCEADARERAK